MNSLLQVRDLEICGSMPDGTEKKLVHNISFDVNVGEVVALIGESGAGKSTIGLAALGFVRPGCSVAGGQIIFNGKDLLALGEEELRQLRGAEIAYIAQSPIAAFNTALKVGEQILEVPLVHGVSSREQAKKEVISLIGQMNLPNAEALMERFPHQLSGGQLQRLMAAMAMCCGPKLLVLDEPTTAIDVTTQVSVLSLFKKMISESGASALYVSHDLAVVMQIADRIIVIRDGQIVETISTSAFVLDARNPYTKQLISACRNIGSPRNTIKSSEHAVETLLQIRNVTASYASVPVIKNVNFDVGRKEIVGVIGESGAGKSTLARVISGLLPARSGTVCFNGTKIPAKISGRDKELLRRIQIVLQSPDVAFNPKQRIGHIIARPISFYFGADRATAHAEVARLLQLVELPAELAERYPRELSGGQRQRVSLARALAAKPELILCDEVTSSLDTIVSASIIRLLESFRDQFGMAIVFISHDISTIASIADRIVVMYDGEVVEEGSAAKVLHPPFHPYTRLLLSSVPQMRKGWLESVPASIMATRERMGAGRLAGCQFSDRCPVVISEHCESKVPPILEADRMHTIRCHRTLSELQ